MPVLAEPRHKGTLVCVVLKARNLPNKKSIGKQDPYAVLSMGEETQKTKPDKRGGQHPTWDEQLHFEIYEDMEDALVNASTNANPDDPSATSSTSRTTTKTSKKILKVACYADDNKEPEFIGEGLVDLTDTLKTGEFDEWVTIKAKDRYAGEVFLELTFYSSAAPPKKKKQPKPVMSGTDTYGGAGTFSRIEDVDDPPSSASTSGTVPAAPPKSSTSGAKPPIPASMRPGGGIAQSHHRMSSSISTSSLSSSLHRPASSMSHSATMNDIAGTLRPSSSLANFDVYTPAYAPTSISRSTSPAPPSSSYHSGAPSEASSIGPAAGHKRHSFASPPSEFGHSIVPSASYYSNHSLTPSQSINYLPGASQGHHGADASTDDRYATIRPGTISTQYTAPRSQSVSHVTLGYSAMPQPDVGDQLSNSMARMTFSHSAQGSTTYNGNPLDKPLPPPTPTQSDDRPPRSHIYQAPAHLASLYSPPPPPPLPIQPGYSHPSSAQDGHHPRPISPAPPSSLSKYGTSPAAYSNPTPSVMNAQAYYQQHQQQQQYPQPQQNSHPSNHLSQPPSLPPRASSPGALSTSPVAGYTPIPSPYSQQGQPLPSPQQQQPQAPRPLPSTQNSTTSLPSPAPPVQSQYPSHLYHPQQQPSPPPSAAAHHHQHSSSYSQSSWQGPPPSHLQQSPHQQQQQQQASHLQYASAAPTPPPQQQLQQQQQHHVQGGMSASQSNGYLYTQTPPPSSVAAPYPTNDGVSVWQGGRAPSPLPPIPGQPQAQPQQQHAYQQQPPPQPVPHQQQQQAMPASSSGYNLYSTSAGGGTSQMQGYYSQQQPQQQQPPPPQMQYQQPATDQPLPPQQQQHQPQPPPQHYIPQSTSYSSHIYTSQQQYH